MRGVHTSESRNWAYIRLDIGESEEIIPIPNVTGDVFDKVPVPPFFARGGASDGFQILLYCEHHRGDERYYRQVDDDDGGNALLSDDWDVLLVKEDVRQVVAILMGANYLGIEPLM